MKKLSFFVAVIMIFSICFNASALGIENDGVGYEYRDCEVSKFVYDKDDHLLGKVEFIFKFRYNKESVTAKCLTVNSAVICQSENTKLKISHEIQNLTSDKGGAYGIVKVLKPDELSGENIKFFASIDSTGNIVLNHQHSDNIILK